MAEVFPSDNELLNIQSDNSERKEIMEFQKHLDFGKLGTWIEFLIGREHFPMPEYETKKEDLLEARRYLDRMDRCLADLEDQLYESIPIEEFNDKDIDPDKVSEPELAPREQTENPDPPPVKEVDEVQHKSDCAVHNDPAAPPGVCDCGVTNPEGDAPDKSDLPNQETTTNDANTNAQEGA